MQSELQDFIMNSL